MLDWHGRPDGRDFQPDSAILVIMNAPDLIWAASTVMAYGPVVEALEPPELRRMVAEWIEATASKYGKENSHERKNH